MNWTIFDVDNARQRIKQRGKEVINTIPPPPAFRTESKALKEMKEALRLLNIDFVSEYKFLKDRKFRFDIYFECNGKRIGVEYDGIISAKSRHTSITGFSKDTEKTNLAQMHGFIVLRYTQLTYRNFINDITKLLQQWKINKANL